MHAAAHAARESLRRHKKRLQGKAGVVDLSSDVDFDRGLGCAMDRLAKGNPAAAAVWADQRACRMAKVIKLLLSRKTSPLPTPLSLYCHGSPRPLCAPVLHAVIFSRLRVQVNGQKVIKSVGRRTNLALAGPPRP